MSIYLRLLFIILVASTHTAVSAYTIYLKDGRVIKNAKHVTYHGQKVLFVIEGKEDDLVQYQISSISLIETNTGKPVESPTTQRKTNNSLQQPDANSTNRKLNPVAAIPRSKVAADINTDIANEFPGSDIFQQIALDEHMKDYDYLSSLPGDEASNRILSELLSNYYPNFIFIRMSYERKLRMYKALNK